MTSSTGVIGVKVVGEVIGAVGAMTSSSGGQPEVELRTPDSGYSSVSSQGGSR